VSLRWTEGEKKTLRADQDGLPCIGLGGLWNWSRDRAPIPDLDHLDHVERSEILTPDSDVWTRPDLLQAVYGLGKELEARGARGAVVVVEKLPAGPDAAKVGIDDYLGSHSVADLETLPKYPLTHRAFTKATAWWRARERRQRKEADAGQADGSRPIILGSPEP